MKKHSMCLAVMITAALVVGCDSGSSQTGGLDISERDETLEEHMFRLSPQAGEDTIYIGDFAPIDIEATAAAHGIALSEVNSIPQTKEREVLSPVAGHRVYLSDGSFIDYGCWLTSVTFAEGGRMQGSFMMEPVTPRNTYSPNNQSNTVTRFIDRESNNKMILWFEEQAYGGIDMGDVANPEFANLPTVHISHVDSVDSDPPYIEVGRTVGALATLKIDRIVRFAPYSDMPEGSNGTSVGCEEYSFYWDPALIEPLPGFDPNGQRWSTRAPYQCYLSNLPDGPIGITINVERLAGYSMSLCALWEAEKGW